LSAESVGGFESMTLAMETLQAIRAGAILGVVELPDSPHWTKLAEVARNPKGRAQYEPLFVETNLVFLRAIVSAGTEDPGSVAQAAEIAEHGETDGYTGKFFEPDMRRSANWVCPVSGVVHVNWYEGFNYPVRTIMQSFAVPRRTLCPDWIPKEAAKKGGHEVRGPIPEPAVRVPFAPALLDAFQRAAMRAPSEWIARQHVRVVLENGDTVARSHAGLAQTGGDAACGGLDAPGRPLRFIWIPRTKRRD
jgi:hypothetical protein